MSEPTDLRDWPHVTLPDARDAADALDWRDQLERSAAAAVAEGRGDFRATFILCLLGGMNDAIRAGTPLSAFPKMARRFYKLAGRRPDQAADENRDVGGEG